MATYTKLFRSRSSRVFGGVAGGLAEYLGISPVFTRIGFVVLALSGGFGFLAYFLIMFITPKQPEITISLDDREYIDDDDRVPSFLRALFIALPIAGISSLFSHHWVVFPFVFGLVIGLYYFWKSSGYREKLFVEDLGIYRSRSNKKIFGVFGGLAEKLNIDPTLLRIVAVVLLFVTGGAPIPIYLLYSIFIPAVGERASSQDRVIVIQ
ncbi:MAG: phage shock protein PspC [Chlorobi bacterium]|nr:phage shock protein PspC [Chlorobiota bacterium]